MSVRVTGPHGWLPPIGTFVLTNANQPVAAPDQGDQWPFAGSQEWKSGHLETTHEESGKNWKKNWEVWVCYTFPNQP